MRNQYSKRMKVWRLKQLYQECCSGVTIDTSAIVKYVGAPCSTYEFMNGNKVFAWHIHWRHRIYALTVKFDKDGQMYQMMSNNLRG